VPPQSTKVGVVIDAFWLSPTVANVDAGVESSPAIDRCWRRRLERQVAALAALIGSKSDKEPSPPKEAYSWVPPGPGRLPSVGRDSTIAKCRLKSCDTSATSREKTQIGRLEVLTVGERQGIRTPSSWVGVAARVQQLATPMIGFLAGGSARRGQARHGPGVTSAPNWPYGQK